MTVWNVFGEPLQLLATFRALFEHRHVGKAAEAQGITQSAASKHLSKLRAWFDDELFTRTSEGMQPTARAVGLVDRIETILREMEALTATASFQPSALQGEMVISTTDEVRRRLLPELMGRLRHEAPDLRLTLLPLTPDYSLHKLESGAVHAVIAVNWHAPPQLIQRRLFDDTFVCLMHERHPLAKKRLTLDRYVRAPHLLVAPLGKTAGTVDELLAREGRRRFVRMSVPEFHQIDEALLDDAHLVTLPRRVATDIAQGRPFVHKPLPFDLPTVRYFLFWHRRFGQDRAHAWLRSLVVDILGEPAMS